MSDYDDRGAYTPPSDRLAFDPRQPVRGGGPAPVTLIVSGLVLASLVGGVFFLYRDGFKHRGEAPALVGAPVADARTPAPPAADANAAPPGLTIDRTASAGPPPKFGPPPAQPLPPPAAQATPVAAPIAAPLAATPMPPAARTAPPPQVVMLQPDASSAAEKVAAKPVLATGPKKLATTPALAAASPKKAATASAPELATATPKKLVTVPSTKLAAAPPPRKTTAAPAPQFAAAAPPTERPVTRHASSMTIASLADAAIQRPRYHARTTNEFKPRTGEAVAPMAAPARKVVASEAKPAPATAPTMAAAVGWVQIGAFSSESLADQGWHDLARVEPAAMAGKGRAVQPFTREDGSVLYRAYVTGFASVSAAQSFCSELRTAGKGCIVK